MQLLVLFKVTTEATLHEVLSYNHEVECHYFDGFSNFGVSVSCEMRKGEWGCGG